MILVPNVVTRPKKDLQTVLARLPDGQQGKVNSLLSLRSENSPLINLTGVFVRFHQIRILDNHSSILGVDISADVYPIIMVVSDASDSPYEFKFLSVFNDVKDLDTLTIDHGLDVARNYSGKIPRFFDIHVVLMKSNERTRDIAKAIQEAINSETGKALQTTITTAINAANPIAGVIVSAATSLLSLITGILSKEKDEQIFYGVASFEDDPDNLGIGSQRMMTDKKNATIIYEVIPRHS